MANGLTTTDFLKQKRIRIQITEAVGDVVVVEVEVRTSLQKLDAVLWTWCPSLPFDDVFV